MSTKADFSVNDLPTRFKRYTIHLSNKDEFGITGSQKIAIMISKSQFIEINNGAVINKAFIVDIVFDIDATRVQFNKLSLEAQRKIEKEIKSVVTTI